MRTSPPRPVSLKPWTRKQRLWFFVVLALGVGVIALSWVVTLRQALSSSVPEIRQQFQEHIDEASQRIEEAGINPGKGVAEFSDAVETAKQAYQEEVDARALENSVTENP